MMRMRAWLTVAAVALATLMTTFAGLVPTYGEPGGQSSAAAMFGNTPSRNMVSDETGLPAEWDVESGMNVKWSQPVGSQAYAGPVVLDGQVYVGTNNEGLRDPALTGDRGVVMAFGTDTGEFLWQVTHTKLPAGRVNDWPLQGVCSTPFIQDGRIYYVSNRAQVVAARDLFR